MELNSIIVDDDEMSRRVLTSMVQKTGNLNLVGVAKSALEAANLVDNNKVHIIFLDIEMPEMTGLDLINTLKHRPHIILVTSKKEYALEAFEYEVADYLLKPVTMQRFLKAVNRVKESLERSEDSIGETVFVKDGSQFNRLEKLRILFVEAFGDYVNIHTKEKKYTVHSTMKNMENKLPKDKFIRVHRSYIVQLDKIDSIDEGIIFINKHMIPIGGSYRESLMKRLNLF